MSGAESDFGFDMTVCSLFRPHHVIYHFHTVFLKNAKSFAGHDGIRIDRTDHDARYAVRKN